MAKIPILTEEELQVFLKREKLGLSLILLACVLPLLFWMGLITRKFYEVFEVPGVKVVVEKQRGFLEISNILKEKGVLANSGIFKIYVFFTGRASSLRSGTYDFSGKYSVVSLVNELTRGPEDISVVIPEGFTVFEIDKRLSEFNLIKPGSLIELAQKPEGFEFDFLPQDNISSLEGFLFPDTYKFSQNTNARLAINKMLENFREKVYQKLDQEITSSPKSLADLITLASVVEKEVPEKEDRKIVSGIIWQRLEKNMLLQVDATIVYAWKLLNPDWKPEDHALTAADLKIKSLYNTYLYRGLPQGPISNPGWEAIDAVLNPTETDYLFYLSTREGKTIFSRTAEEHAAAVRKYLR